MKKLSFVVFISLFAFVAKATDQQVESTIAHVTVFQQGAQVMRSAKVTVAKGTHTLYFKGLTNRLNTESIGLKGTGALTILSITHQRNFLTSEDRSDEMLELEKQMELIDTRLREIESAEHGLILEREVLEANRAIGGTAGVSTLELQKATEFARKIRERNALEWYNLEKEKKEKQAERSKLQKQWNVARSAFSSKSGVVVVRVEASKITEARFELEYIVMGAGWQSSYDARVTDLSKPINLTHKAIITQNTGEDWTNVDLTLATGNPSAGAQIPYMKVWYVNYGNSGYFVDKVKGSFANAKIESYEDDLEKSVENQQFSLNQNITQQEYSVERKQSMASGNSPITVVLREVELAAKYEYHAKPRLDKDAFLLAKLYDWNQYDLLDGELSLFNNDTYVGKSMLSTQNPNDTLELSLGRDKGLIVQRERVYNMQEKTLFGINKIDHYVWKLELRNNKKTAVKIVLHDQVPLSKNEEIKVTVHQTGGGKYQEKTGMISWRLTLDPAASKTYEIAYEVKYPRDKAKTVMFY